METVVEKVGRFMEYVNSHKYTSISDDMQQDVDNSVDEWIAEQEHLIHEKKVKRFQDELEHQKNGGNLWIN